jgi:hypothetical protein
MDRFLPSVMAGRSIKSGAAVALLGEVAPAVERLITDAGPEYEALIRRYSRGAENKVYVQDEGGNRQMVRRSSLVLIRTQEAAHA